MLLYCLGEEAETVLASTKVYDTVLAKFNSFFKVCNNVIYERARFNRRKQLEGEPAERYIFELYQLANQNEYGALKEEMIRDRLVVGIRDSPLSERTAVGPRSHPRKGEENDQTTRSSNKKYSKVLVQEKLQAL